MIFALHLLWIIPLSAAVGAFILGIFVGGDYDPDWYDDHDVSGLIEED